MGSFLEKLSAIDWEKEAERIKEFLDEVKDYFDVAYTDGELSKHLYVKYMKNIKHISKLFSEE